MPLTKLDVVIELFQTEVSFIQHVQQAAMSTDKSRYNQFYNSHLQKFLNFVSPNSQLVSQYSKIINSDNYQFLLEEFTLNFIKVLNSDDFLSTYIVLCQFELRKESACYFCGRMPRYKLIFDEFLKRESDEQIKIRIINPILEKLKEICTIINLNFGIISMLNVKETKFFQIETLIYELVILDVNFNINKYIFGKLIYKKRKLEHGMIYIPINSNQLILLTVNGPIDQLSSIHSAVDFGNEGKIVYSKYSIYKIIDLMKCEISYKEEGIEIKTKSKTITMNLNLFDSKINIWKLMCLRRFKL
ncbi:predicted protein [Naegleria gruberi]|uniref:Predicted protein n=1 Tax=Naegleria gruberi TaxID=5762 RepID=D2W2U1_NAEGR|nr:uncharacterized protein NAEGRDRAFT_75712 [Naegleria gruberi]EFC36572.1 predicted protein [Naegleria gruberi]|eukprot:XP_002669316.1 predicted protein [Naegleria gruberi strain NEG-M]